MKKLLLLISIAFVFFSDLSMAASKAPESQTSTIYLYRGKSQLSGSLLDAWFYVDGLKVASLKPSQYAAVKVTPGKHTVELRADVNYKKNSASVNVGKNQSIYLKAEPVGSGAITMLVAPFLDAGTVKAFGISKVSNKTFTKAKPQLKAANTIIYDKAPVKTIPGMANVYIYRVDAGIKGGVQTAWIYRDNKKVANMVDHQYIVLTLPRGKHTIAVRAETNVRKDTLKLNVKSGQNYYFTIETNAAHVATLVAIPILDMVTSKAFNFKQVDSKQFNAIKGTLGRLRPQK